MAKGQSISPPQRVGLSETGRPYSPRTVVAQPRLGPVDYSRRGDGSSVCGFPYNSGHSDWEHIAILWL